jgi:threonylcarbamoyladenosine tRNA methylthiotransferase MtaB
MSKGRSFIIKTLGCKANQYDSQLLGEDLLRCGLVECRGRGDADVCIVNTCTVTAQGDAKSRQAIRALRRENPNAKVVVTGCYAHTNPAEVRQIRGVDVVADNDLKNSLADRICALLGIERRPTETRGSGITFFSGHTRAFVKIQDGCNKRCSYCIVRFARGASRSRAIPDILEEIEMLVGNGYREVVLTGIHIGSFGLDDGRQENRLPEVIERLQGVKGLLRVRLSSIDPTEITSGLIAALRSSPQACHHLHIPLQSGSDRILQKMNRDYMVGEYLQTIAVLRDGLPDISITTDVMVGFPGEEEEDFEESRRVVSQVEFTKVHVFPFSSRPGTPAHGFAGRVPAKVIKERAAQLAAEATAGALKRREKLEGQVVEVLVEREFARDEKTILAPFLRDGGTVLEGFPSNYLRTVLLSNGGGIEQLKNRIVRVRIEACDDRYLYGRQI